MSASMVKKMQLEQEIFHNRSGSSNLSSSDIARIMAALGKKWSTYLNYLWFVLKMNSFTGEKAKVLIEGKVMSQQFIPNELEVLTESDIHVLYNFLFFKIPANYISLLVHTLQIVVHISCKGS